VIRSRVLLAISIACICIVLLVLTIFDLRDKEDRAYSYFKDGKYEEVIDLFTEKERIDSELVYSLLSESVSALEKKANETKTKEETLAFIKKHKQLKVIEWETTLGIYHHIEDPYFPALKKHGNHYKKALISKIATIHKIIPKDKASYYLLLLILEDPRGLEESYSRALANLLRFPMEQVGEIESNFLLETLSYLSSSSLSLFYENYFTVTGTNVNLRSGPGKENKEVGKVTSPDSTFCFEKDNHEETISGKSGVFVQCFYPHLGKSAWIFSGFLMKTTPNEKYISELENRFKSSSNEIKIDFVGWLGASIPPSFYGTYIPRERVVVSGEVGFPLYGNKTKEFRKICKLLPGEKNYFDFSFQVDQAKEVLPLFDLNLVYEGASHLVYTVEADHESISINRNRYILDLEHKKENLSLHIESREANKLIGSLWQRNTGLLQKLKSEPMEISSFTTRKYAWEICLPLASVPTKDKVLLFEIKTGNN
jgi:hypothetical protein